MSIFRRLTRWLGTDTTQMTHITAGNPAPQFSLQGLDGKSYSLQSLLRQGPVVAAFFKVSCPICQFAFPFIERLYKKYAGPSVTFLGISQDDARATNKFNSEYGITFPVAPDEKGYPVSNGYGLTNVPTVFLIDTDGIVKLSFTGFDKSGLEAIANDLAGRQKVPLEALFRPNESVPAYKPG